MKATTAQTFKLITAATALGFRPMTRTEYATWADAAPDALIAYCEGGAVAKAVEEITECTLLDSGVAIIISGETIEFSAATPDGEPVALALNLDRLI